MTDHVFISYARTAADAGYVGLLENQFRAAGLTVSFDRGASDPGGDELRRQIDTCVAFVVVMSPASAASPDVARELNRAISQQRPILPLLLGGAPYPPLVGVPFEDVRAGNPPSAAFVAALRRWAGLDGSAPEAAGADSADQPVGSASEAGPEGPPDGPVATPHTGHPPVPSAPVPPGAVPPVPVPVGTAPPGTAPPGTAPAGTVPPGTVPPGTVPPGTVPPGYPFGPVGYPPLPGGGPVPRRNLVPIVAGVVVLVIVATVATVLLTRKTAQPQSGQQPFATAGPTTTGPQAVPTTPTPVGPAFTACLVTDQGGLDDRSFNASTWAGFQAAANAPGANIQIRNTPSTSQADYAPNLIAFVNQGCDLIVAVGGLMGDDLARVAQQYPSQQFAIVDANLGLSNVYGMQYDVAEAAFLAGYLAAGYSKTGKVGTYGGLKIPPVTLFMDGLAQGVAYYNSVKKTHVSVLGWDRTRQDGLFANTFTNPAAGKAISDTLHSQGADVIMPVAGGTGLGTLQDAAAGKFVAIWPDTDGCVSTDYCAGLLTSVQKNFAGSVQNLLVQAAQAKAGGTGLTGGYLGTLANNGVEIADYHQFADKVPPALATEVQDVQQKIISGQIKVTSPAAPN